MKHSFKRILLTGAAGKLGSVLREPLRDMCESLLLSDMRAPEVAPTGNEIFLACDLGDHSAVERLIEGVDLIVHFGGMAHERPLPELVPGNFLGPYNLYDNALKHGVRRIVMASSNHVTGFYDSHLPVSSQMPYRPDSLYAVSKVHGEMLARFYYDRHGVESVCLRIGSCIPVPRSTRCLSSWLSYGDLAELVRCAATAPDVGFAAVWGISNNRQDNWRGDDAERIGYRPRDSAEDWREEIIRDSAPEDEDPRLRWQGGNIIGRDYRKPETLFPNPSPVPSFATKKQ